MKTLALAVILAFSLVSSLSAEPALQLVDPDGDGWVEWAGNGTNGDSYVSPGGALLASPSAQNIEWLKAQLKLYPRSKRLRRRLAFRLWQDKRVDESLQAWDRMESLDSDGLIEAAYFHFQAKRWGRAFQLLAQAGPEYFSVQSGALKANPRLASLFQAGWKVEAGHSALRKKEHRIRIQQAQNQGRPATLGSVTAQINAEKGLISFPEISLQMEISPPSAFKDVAVDLAGDRGATEIFGRSVKGKDIPVTWFGQGPETVVFFGAFHGDEPESAFVLEMFEQLLRSRPDLMEGRRAVIVPVVNPDGLEFGQRRNANGVDLNRNYPTSNWNSEGRGTNYWGGKAPGSEPETQVVLEVLERFQPARIVSIHCPYRCVNYDGPAESLATAMSAENGYKVEPSIGYPTPGSFGTFAGIEKRIPTITLELPPTGKEDVWSANRPALIRALRGVPGQTP